MVSFQCNVYYADMYGRVFRIVGPPEQFLNELIAQVPLIVDVCWGWHGGAWSSLVESDGELLLVRIGKDIAFKVFKVDIERRVMEEVKSVGSSCALFLGDERSLSVDVDKLIPSIDGDCIYLTRMQQGTREACVYNLRDGTMGIFSMDYDLDRPFSLVHVLLMYCDSCYD
jgi:hypothetical protein